MANLPNTFGIPVPEEVNYSNYNDYFPIPSSISGGITFDQPNVGTFTAATNTWEETKYIIYK